MIFSQDGSGDPGKEKLAEGRANITVLRSIAFNGNSLANTASMAFSLPIN